ncbi:MULTISPECIES: trypsin-like peptidase domain-containing protein [Streptomyces]|uniref:V8-like Glu-specific endopeptidase n=1 Tax=Streptomyces chartreusis NRRL 3882 TaxID=1079985 RepID=A0A2N9BBT9_STRCX|nr:MULTISPECIES: trypsin-like peptidase domain-containing protein [Streptomyces]MYS90448.1 trypsin-like serine protease [Streptomyces sp. SID5464]SOR80828.1 V8-like Glu-specific endopeptidase [Streptomyces chartreusis NRRL 3882]
MKRVLSLAVVLVALTSASTAVADDGAGPLGVTVTAGAVAGSARVGVLVPAGRAAHPAGAHFCTASVVRAPYRNLVVTAAHCLDGRGELVFVPGYRNGRAPYGVWKVKRRFLPHGWVEGRREDSDVAFAVVAPRGGKGVEDVVGGYRFATGTATGATAVTLTGYPDSRETPVSCTNKPTVHSPTQQRIVCPGFTGGTSGSPWVNGDGQVVGVLGGHDDGGTTPDVSYSVVLRAEAERLYREAAGDP